eukprot:6924022-Ditylum_brightwellii.AAC.1
MDGVCAQCRRCNERYFIKSVRCTRQRHVGIEREYINKDSSLQPELKEVGLDFLNKDDEAILDGTGGEAEEQ